MLDSLPDDIILCLLLPRLHPRHALSPSLLAVGATCRALRTLLTTIYLPSLTVLDLSPPHTPPLALLRVVLRAGLAPTELVANGVRKGGLEPLLDALAAGGVMAGDGRGEAEEFAGNGRASWSATSARAGWSATSARATRAPRGVGARASAPEGGVGVPAPAHNVGALGRLVSASASHSADMDALAVGLLLRASGGRLSRLAVPYCGRLGMGPPPDWTEAGALTVVDLAWTGLDDGGVAGLVRVARG